MQDLGSQALISFVPSIDQPAELDADSDHIEMLMGGCSAICHLRAHAYAFIQLLNIMRAASGLYASDL